MRSKLFFYSNHREDDMSIGISKKVHAQIQAFQSKNMEVFYSAYYKNGVGIFDNSGRLVEYKRIYIKKTALKKLIRRIKLLNFCRKYLKHNKMEFQCLYMRFHFWDIFSQQFVKEAKKNKMKVIVEAHSYPYYVNKTNFYMKIVYFLDRKYSSNISRFIDLVAAISESVECIWNCKTIRIENGISLIDNVQRQGYSHCDDSITLMSVANEQSAHGIDRLIRGVKNYYESNNTQKITVWLVGEYLKETKALVSQLDLDEKILFIGKKFGNDLYRYYSMADIGIGPLAGYRAGIHSGTCLKTKEYFAVGLPFITCASINAEINKFPYIYVVPENDEPIDIEKILKFKESLENYEEVAYDMHQYAMKHYMWEKEVEKILECLNLD